VNGFCFSHFFIFSHLEAIFAALNTTRSSLTASMHKRRLSFREAAPTLTYGFKKFGRWDPGSYFGPKALEQQRLAFRAAYARAARRYEEEMVAQSGCVQLILAGMAHRFRVLHERCA
jgi:hypothetical protein